MSDTKPMSRMLREEDVLERLQCPTSPTCEERNYPVPCARCRARAAIRALPPDPRAEAMTVATFSHVDGRDLLDEVCRGAHHIDISVRRDGQDETFEGDWLKALKAARDADNPPRWFIESYRHLDPRAEAAERLAQAIDAMREYSEMSVYCEDGPDDAALFLLAAEAYEWFHEALAAWREEGK